LETALDQTNEQRASRDAGGSGGSGVILARICYNWRARILSRLPPKATEEEKLNWEVEKLRNEVRNLSRTFVFAIVTAILALAATAYQIYDKVSSLSVQQYEKDRLQADIDDLKKKRQELGTQQEVATSNFNQYLAAFNDLVSKTSLTDKEKIQQLQQTPPAFQFAAMERETNLPARIYLQYLDSQGATNTFIAQANVSASSC
jgi:hypothetical protein